ncbi:chorismate synthase [bacterium]|nr:chorismate synthase [bacterium]
MRANFENFKIEIFGESHAEEIGVKLIGIPEGYAIEESKIQSELDRRKSGNNPWSTPRQEEDKVVILSGIKDGKTDGKEFLAVIKNNNKKSGDYENLKYKPRPSHADYAAKMKFGLDYDMAGGGKFSGRMTAPIVIAGSIAKQILANDGIFIGGYVSSVASIKAPSYRDRAVTEKELKDLSKQAFPVLSDNIKTVMEKAIMLAKNNGDSVGGSVDCIVYNLGLGVGDYLFDGIESKISASLFAIPAVKAVEFGLGIDFANKFGSEVNDEFLYENGVVGTKTNNNGGINGGISNGMPITIRVSVKPTPSICKEQNTIDLLTKENTKITIKGRHDACIVPRAVAPIESAVALAILDLKLRKE